MKESDYHYNQSAIRGRDEQIPHLILRGFFAVFLTTHLQRHFGMCSFLKISTFLNICQNKHTHFSTYGNQKQI